MLMSEPWLTIITVCKNIATEIGDTCESVVKQTLQNFEWMVVDGASTDGTLTVLEKYRPQITRLISEPDSGIYNAMNKGIGAATGKYLLFLNGGDYLATDTVLSEVFSRDLDADIIYGNGFLQHSDGGIETSELMPSVITKVFFAQHTLLHQSTFIRRSLFDRYGLYNENYRVVSDWEKWIVFAENGCSFVKIDLAVAFYRNGGISSSIGENESHHIEWQQVRKAHFSPAEIKAGIRRHNELYGYKKIYSWGDWGNFSVFSVTQLVNQKKIRYHFCGIPLLKIERRPYGKKYRLLGMLKIWESKAGGNYSPTR
jgi:glycosyltransferase involved in cell wall biosynthesis